MSPAGRAFKKFEDGARRFRAHNRTLSFYFRLKWNIDVKVLLTANMFIASNRQEARYENGKTRRALAAQICARNYSPASICIFAVRLSL